MFKLRQGIRSTVQSLDSDERTSLKLFGAHAADDQELFEEGLLRREIYRAVTGLTSKGLADRHQKLRQSGVEIVRLNGAALNLLAPLIPGGVQREWIELDDSKIQGSGASGAGSPP